MARQNVSCRLMCILLAVLLLFALLTPFSVYAQGKAEPEQKSTLTIHYQHDNIILSNVEFYLYHVADLNDNIYELSGDFEDCPVDLNELMEDSTNAASTLAAYVQTYNLTPSKQQKTSENGVAVFDTLDAGLYLVIGEDCTQGDVVYKTTPFLVSLPYYDQAEDQLHYDITAEPKSTDVSRTDNQKIDVSVCKTWNDTGHEDKRPRQIQVVLLKDKTSYQSFTLSEENYWRHTWTGLDSRHTWSVIEKEVPRGYTVAYTVTSTVTSTLFTITNTYAASGSTSTPPPADTPSKPSVPTSASSSPSQTGLPQTGLLQWPIPVLTVLGLAFFAYGCWIVFRKKERP